jgi:hypothetical protein
MIITVVLLMAIQYWHKQCITNIEFNLSGLVRLKGNARSDQVNARPGEDLTRL